MIVSFGEMLIDFVPTESGVSLAEAPGFLKAPGGAPANVAIAITRLGGKAAFVGKLGDDEFGHMLAGILKQNKVSAEGITFDKGARTALAFVTLRSDGEREFMFYRNPSADMLLKPEELNLNLIKTVSYFIFVDLFIFRIYPIRSRLSEVFDGIWFIGFECSLMAVQKTSIYALFIYTVIFGWIWIRVYSDS